MKSLIILGQIGLWQVVLIIIVLILLLGGKKIPQLMKSIGQGIRDYKVAKNGEKVKHSDEK